MNPMQLIQMLRSGQNPQQLAMNLLESQMGETPNGSESFKSSQEWSIRRY